MKHVLLVLNVFLITCLLSFILVDVVFADNGGGDQLSGNLLMQFAPILAATVAIERVLQMGRNFVSPNPEKGLLARKSKALQYYTMIGGVALGLVIVLVSDDLRLLALAGVDLKPPIIDAVLTGITIGMGTEFVHEAIKIIAEGKRALRARR